MKNKRRIIAIIVIVMLIGGLFGVQHYFLQEYGCKTTCIIGGCNGMFENLVRTCSFKTFLTNEDISEKLFLRFGINAKQLIKTTTYPYRYEDSHYLPPLSYEHPPIGTSQVF